MQTRTFRRNLSHPVGGETAQITAIVSETYDQELGQGTVSVLIHEIIMPDGQLVYPRMLEPNTFRAIIAKVQDIPSVTL